VSLSQGNAGMEPTVEDLLHQVRTPIENESAAAITRLRRTACLIAAREKQIARLQDEFRKLLIQSAQIDVDGHDLPEIVETIDAPPQSVQLKTRAGKIPRKAVAIIGATAVLALLCIPFPLSVSGLWKVFPARSVAIHAPLSSEESLILLAFDASQAIRVKPGMPATVRFESLPGPTFQGKVESVGRSSAEKVYVGIRLNRQPPETVYGTDANTQIRYGRFQLGKWIMQTLVG
jgi:hypothetical protein